MEYAFLGSTIIAWWTIIFLIIGARCGKFGEIVVCKKLSVSRIFTGIIRSLWIPVIFLFAGLIPMVHFAQCGDPYPNWCEDTYTRADSEGCVSDSECSGVVVRNKQNETDWLLTYANAYGKGVVQFQVVPILLLFLSGGAWLALFVANNGTRLVAPPLKKIINRIPIRW